MTYLFIVSGGAANYPLQGRIRGSGAASRYGQNDILTAEVRASRSTIAEFVPAVTWHLNNGSQTGYEQGQVLVSITAAQSALLVPGILYTILVWRAPAGDVARITPIVRVRLNAEPPPYP